MKCEHPACESDRAEPTVVVRTYPRHVSVYTVIDGKLYARPKDIHFRPADGYTINLCDTHMQIINRGEKFIYQES